MLCHFCESNVWYYSVRLKQWRGFHTSMKILIKKWTKLLNQLDIKNQCMKLNNGDNQQRTFSAEMHAGNIVWNSFMTLFFWISLMNVTIVEVCMIVDELMSKSVFVFLHSIFAFVQQNIYISNKRSTFDNISQLFPS